RRRSGSRARGPPQPQHRRPPPDAPPHARGHHRPSVLTHPVRRLAVPDIRPAATSQGDHAMTDFWRRLRAALTHSGPGYDQPTQAETDLRAVFATLAGRYDEMAERLTAGHPTTFYAHFTEAQERQAARAHAYRNAVADLRDVLHTGRIPHGLMTDAELEQHGTPAAD